MIMKVRVYAQTALPANGKLGEQLVQSLIVEDLGLATEYKLLPVCPTHSTAWQGLQS